MVEGFQPKECRRVGVHEQQVSRSFQHEAMLSEFFPVLLLLIVPLHLHRLDDWVQQFPPTLNKPAFDTTFVESCDFHQSIFLIGCRIWIQ